VKTSATRIEGLGTTIFAEMSQLAARTGSVNLGQGFPDTDGPTWVVDAVTAAMRDGRNQYAPGMGVPELRAAVARHQRRFYGLEVDPDTEVAVTTGATEAIAAALLGLVDPGDEVVVLEPYYDSYVAMLQMTGAIRRPVTLRAPDFRLPVDELRAAVTPHTRIILLNSPHNPTGTVLTRDELQAVADLAVEHDLVVVSDEVYEHLTFGADHVPIAALPGMAERTLTISSAGKSFSFTGWKVGWASGPTSLVSALVGAKQFMTYTSGAPFQPAIAQAWTEPSRSWCRCATSSLHAATSCVRAWTRSDSASIDPRARTSRPPTCDHSATTTGCGSAAHCPDSAVSWPSRIRSSTTTSPRAARSYAGPSASPSR